MIIVFHSLNKIFTCFFSLHYLIKVVHFGWVWVIFIDAFSLLCMSAKLLWCSESDTELGRFSWLSQLGDIFSLSWVFFFFFLQSWFLMLEDLVWPLPNKFFLQKIANNESIKSPLFIIYDLQREIMVDISVWVHLAFLVHAVLVVQLHMWNLKVVKGLNSPILSCHAFYFICFLVKVKFLNFMSV